MQSSSPELRSLRGVGPAAEERLRRLGINRPLDLLFLLPQRYEDRTRLTPLGALRAGQRVVVEGVIAVADVAYRGRRSLLVRISDRTGQLTLRFFHFSRTQQNSLSAGTRLRCFGEVRAGPLGPEMVHPEYRALQPGQAVPLEERLTPVYPTVEGLPQFRLRDLTDQALNRWLDTLPDALPAGEIARTGLPPLREALQFVHRPPVGADLHLLASGRHPCQRRLALEEMLAHHLGLRQIRERARAERAIALPATQTAAATLRERFVQRLGFELTAGQQAALADIDTDLAAAHPMMRLVQGDVGCGKTVVAAAAALVTIAHGQQVAVMAPTELLAEQHRNTFQRWFEPLGITVVWLSGSLRKKAREQAYAAAADGSAQLLVGTHALFQSGLAYRSLALVIVDEQHRFGVHQRLQLMDKGASDMVRPHQLVMTATPIPRTLAMTLYADLDTSIIRELPPGRQPVTTIALPERRRPEVVARVRDACRGGAQAYWVCPLIEESDHLESQAAEPAAAALAEALPGLRIGLIHGRMSSTEKERVMKAFVAGQLDLLVATTVIEVGVDVPSASLMIIENAERLGLSQLHQLRGRVGRGTDASVCVLLYRSPLAEMARARLEVLRATNDGFEVAQRDLELRGPGEVLGTRQTGLMQLRVADLVRDADLAPAVQRIARELLATASPAVEELRQRWIGAGDRYGAV
ncbi:MAG: ATP-dependent DNA helicase RecG [Gammaproteobacteria bacterium]|nr:ATP-dependent DNA helicase RecG [Gammaproteobacteria bacterium]